VADAVLLARVLPDGALLLGLADRRFRDLYRFTVGGGVEDRRLATRPGYEEAARRRT
jgi:hypothetical protein